jgi:hypothetical protein
MPLGEYSQQFKTTLSKGLLKKFKFELHDQELSPSQLLRYAIIKYFADKEKTNAGRKTPKYNSRGHADIDSLEQDKFVEDAF